MSRSAPNHISKKPHLQNVFVMPPPSPLAISCSSVQRLLKEESTYRAELASQERRLQKLESDDGEDDGNREYLIKQEVSRFEPCPYRLKHHKFHISLAMKPTVQKDLPIGIGIEKLLNIMLDDYNSVSYARSS